MRVGLGFGLFDAWQTSAQLKSLAVEAEACGLDSLWLSDHVKSPTADPISSLAYCAAVTTRLKLGTSVLVLPGRQPLLVAKALATIDRLSDGRLLPVFGKGVAEPYEHAAFGVARHERSQLLEEGVAAVRAAFADAPNVIGFDAVRPLDLWIGGRSEPELRRAGRVADGWLGHYLDPCEAGSAVRVICEEARAHGRQISSGHFGMYLFYGRQRVAEPIRAVVERQGRSADAIPIGVDSLRQRLVSYGRHGITKFVLVPAGQPANWHDEIAWLGHAVRHPSLGSALEDSATTTGAEPCACP